MHRDLHLIERKRSSFGEERRDTKFQRGVFGICCDVVHQVARERNKDKLIIVNEDAELLVQRRENRPSLRLFVLTLVLCAEIRRQLCHQISDERRHLPAPVLLERNLARERVELQHHRLIEK